MTTVLYEFKNFNVSIKESKRMFIFTKLVPGGSAHSFGIHVAKMAGMPQTCLQQRKKIKTLETSHQVKKEKHFEKE